MPTLENIKRAQANIDQTLSEFKQLFSGVFFKNIANKLEGVPAENAETLFNDLWEQMEIAATSNVKETLDYYFETIKTDTVNLKDYQKDAPVTSSSPIAKSCEAISLRLNWLHRSELTELFTQIISVYHWFAKQQLFLRQLNEYQSLQVKLSNANCELQKKHNAIDIICQAFMSMMQKRGYLEAHTPWSMRHKYLIQSINQMNEKAIEEIDLRLSKIVAGKKANKLFSRAKEQNVVSDEKKIEAQACAKFLLKTVENVQALKNDCLPNNANHPSSISNIPTSRLVNLTRNLAETRFELIDEMEAIMALSAFCASKGDKDTANKIRCWQSLNDGLKSIKEEVGQGYPDEAAMRAKMLACINGNIQEEKIQLHGLQCKTTDAEQLFKNAIEGLQTLAAQYSSISEMKSKKTIGYFLKNNWGKILIGAAVCATVGGAVAVGIGFFLALNILVLPAVVAAGFLIGANLGLIAGLVADKSSKHVELTDKDVESLLGYDSISIRKRLDVKFAQTVDPTMASERQNVQQVGAALAFFPTVKPVNESVEPNSSPMPDKSNYQPRSRSL